MLGVVLPFSAVKEKPKPKKVIALFDEDDEDGDIFNEKLSAPTPAQSKKEAVEEQGKPPDKKVKIGILVSSRSVLTVLLAVRIRYFVWYIYIVFCGKLKSSYIEFIVFRCRQGPFPCLVLALKACSVKA